MTNQQGAPEAPKSTALDGKTELFHVPGHPLLVRAVDFNRLYAENEALQQGYDAARLEIDHLRGATKMMDPAQPEAWLVYLPSIDTQNVYDSQDDPGYVDDVTNHDDAVVTPLYQMEVPAGHALVPVTGITATPTTQPAPVAQGDAEDAARYRWLREHKALNNTHCWHFQGGPIIPGLLTLDAAIDAARKQGANHD